MPLTLEQSYGLNPIQLAQIQQLESVCNQFEALTMKLNWITLRDRPRDQGNDFLAYADEQLVGYLALYGFNQREAEISGMTHPAYRRRGIFKQLVALASTELKARTIPDMLFICEQQSTAGKTSLQALAARYEFSEYKMRWQEPAAFVAAAPVLQLQPAEPEDIPELVSLDELCFGVSAEAAQSWLAQDMLDPQRRVWLVTLGPAKIGKINIWRSETETYISGFCIRPEYRGQGHGKTVLTRLLEQLAAENHAQVVLEVACANEHALSLYQQCGFRTVTAYDYYRLPVS
ncbi:MAG: GNAT family N-acetyltransferase [Anaerolineales bacterium]|nr:GNAT family N-acetyltransferase [Anaerolineales bacterium]